MSIRDAKCEIQKILDYLPSHYRPLFLCGALDAFAAIVVKIAINSDDSYINGFTIDYPSSAALSTRRNQYFASRASRSATFVRYAKSERLELASASSRFAPTDAAAHQLSPYLGAACVPPCISRVGFQNITRKKKGSLPNLVWFPIPWCVRHEYLLHGLHPGKPKTCSRFFHC
jgi:hypothetical protein